MLMAIVLLAITWREASFLFILTSEFLGVFPFGFADVVFPIIRSTRLGYGRSLLALYMSWLLRLSTGGGGSFGASLRTGPRLRLRWSGLRLDSSNHRLRVTSLGRRRSMRLCPNVAQRKRSKRSPLGRRLVPILWLEGARRADGPDPGPLVGEVGHDVNERGL